MTISLREEEILAFLMKWRDEHVDERGAKQSPSIWFVRSVYGNMTPIHKMQRGGWLVVRGDEIVPTSKAEVWWLNRKFTV